MSGRRTPLLVAAVGVALAAACGAPQSAAPPATVTVTSPATATGTGNSSTQSGGTGSKPCNVQLTLSDGQVSVQSTGGGGSTQTINSDTFYSCGGGPKMQVALGADTLTLTADGSPVRIPSGQTQQVGGYRVTVMSVSEESAQFTVYPPGA